MNGVIHIGDTTAREISRECIFDPVNGPTTVSLWEGSEEDLTAQAQLFNAQGFRAQVFPHEGPVYRMRVAMPDENPNSPPVDTWERDTATVPDILKSSAVGPALQAFEMKIFSGYSLFKAAAWLLLAWLNWKYTLLLFFIHWCDWGITGFLIERVSTRGKIAREGDQSSGPL